MRYIDMFPAGAHQVAADPRKTQATTWVPKPPAAPPEMDLEAVYEVQKVQRRLKQPVQKLVAAPPCTRCARSKQNEKCEPVRRPLKDPGGDAAHGKLLVVLAAFADGVGYVTKVLRKLGWAGEIYFDVPVRCGSGREKMKPEQIDACRTFAAFTLAGIKPTHILTCGTAASRSVLGRTVMVHATRGAWQLTELFGKKVPVVMTCATLDASTNYVYAKHFENEARMLIDGPWDITPYPEGRAVVVESYKDLPAFREWAAGAPYLAFDTETDGIQFQDDFRIASIAFAKPGSDDVFVFFESLADYACVTAIKQVLLEHKLWGSNINYDVRSVWCAWGIDVSMNVDCDVRDLYKQFWAGNLAELDEMGVTVGFGQHKAEADAALKAAVKDVREEWEEDGGDHDKKRVKAYAYARLPSPIMERYVARDTLCTLVLGESLRYQAANHEFIGQHYEEVVKPACQRFFRIERRGMLVDRERLKIVDTQLTAREAELTAAIAQHGIDPDKPDSIRAFFEREGIRTKRLTPKAKQAAEERGEVLDSDTRSTDKRALLQAKQIVAMLRPELTVIADMIEYRKVSKLLSTNVKTILRYVGSDGRVHPSFLPNAAASGRSSVKDPAAHSTPGRTKEGKAFKSVFVAPPGYSILVLDYCLTPGTKVLTADLRWVNVEDLRVNDELVGFDEQPTEKHSRSFRRSVVEKTKLLRKECVTLHTTQGDITVSADHMFLGQRLGANGSKWIQAKDFVPRDTISYMIKPWEVNTSREGGYMAGLLDGEGWVAKNRVGFAQNRGVVLDNFLRIAKETGFELFSYERNAHGKSGKCLTLHLNKAGPFEGLRWLGVFRPDRLLQKAATMWEGKRCWGQRSAPAVVLGVSPAGEREVVAVQTSTRTLIAEGFFSHNCTLEVFGAAFASGDPTMLEILGSGADFHGETAKKIAPLAWGCTAEDVEREIKEAKAKGQRSPKRDQAKTTGLATMYRIGPESLSEQVGTTVPEAKKLIDAFAKIYSGYAAWVRDQDAFVASTGYTQAYWCGRKSRMRWLPEVGYADRKRKGQAYRAGSNHPIQSECSDYCLMSGLLIEEELERRNLPAGVIMEVHDSIVLEVRDDVLVEVARLAQDIMTSWPAGPFPLRVSMEVGPSWGEAAEWEFPDAQLVA